MIPNLSRYLDRLYATIHSRYEIVVESSRAVFHNRLSLSTPLLLTAAC